MFIKSKKKVNPITAPIAPQLYHWLVRPKWFTKHYIHRPIEQQFDLKQKTVLDFGSGTGANSTLCTPGHYIGLEPDQSRVHYSRKLYPDYNFEVLNGPQLPLDDRSIDYVMLIAVLHHIDTKQIKGYLDEFKRVLKPNGNIIVMEPFICKENPLCNWFMQFYDKGDYLRSEAEYLKLFQNPYQAHIIKKFKKCLLYHELFFSVSFKHSTV
jgi:ubiquinone/menaquinone biosynthesis C-methylase UbiE